MSTHSLYGSEADKQTKLTNLLCQENILFTFVNFIIAIFETILGNKLHRRNNCVVVQNILSLNFACENLLKTSNIEIKLLTYMY